MELVKLKTFDNYFSANILLSRLQQAGIDCMLLDENTVTIDPILSNAIGGIKLAVFEKDEVQARLLLKQFDMEYMESACCPQCGARDIRLVPKKSAGNYFAAILTWLFSSYAVSAEKIYQCQQRGYESEDLPVSEHISNDIAV